MNSTRDRNASRHGDAFDPRCNIDAIAEDIVVVDDDVSQMDADAELDPLGLGYLRVLVSHAALNFDGASRCIDGTGKFDEHTSPVVLTMRPRCLAIVGSTSVFLKAFSCASVPSSSAPIKRL